MRDTALEGYRLMLASRETDMVCREIIAGGGVVPNYHGGFGLEAGSVGMGMALERRDYLLYTYRDFGALMAKGISLAELAGDLLLRVTGTTKGFGGIMHVVAPERGIVGRNGVFGSRFGVAVGLGMASKYQNDGRVTLCAYGEAEGGRGPLYEAINMACLAKLPIVFAPLNNGFTISTRTKDVYAGGSMTAMWRGSPLPVMIVDGNALEDVTSAVGAAVRHARSGLGPVMVEICSYRVDPHIPAEATVFGTPPYRSEAEIDSWRARDPIQRFEELLLSAGALDSKRVQEIRGEVTASVRQAFDAALAAPGPSEDGVHRYVYLDEETAPK
jgi:TPP-dependent pyruvate/acetoin dehydrogenase alpha subunit